MKFTPRQAEVVANLTRITTDGSRHNPMFWLGEKHVSIQVRSLLSCGFVELQNGRLVKAEPVSPLPTPAAFDTDAAVSTMRSLFERSKS